MVDVVVVGGGVCGLFCSLILGKRGVDVTVFEEHLEVGKPSHCAGHLSIRSLERLGVYPLPKEIIENEYRGAVFYSPKGNKFDVEFDSPVTCAVSREKFDKYVAKLAVQAGVDVRLGTRVDSLVFKKAYVKGVNITHGEKRERLDAKVVVDAEGVSSRILRQTGLRPLNYSMMVNGVSAEVDRIKDVDDDFVEVYLGNAYAPGFYAWLMPGKDGTAKVGLAAKKGNPKELLEKFMEKHPIASRKLCESRIVRKSFHPITLGGPVLKTFTNGFLAVGDVASQVKPTTGGGVILGMNCARIAAETVYKALEEGNDFSEKTLSEYQRGWRKLMGFDLWVMLRMRKMFERLSDAQIDKFILQCRKLRLHEILKNFRNIDFQGKSLTRIIWHPSILSFGVYFMFEMFKSETPLTCNEL